jgi:hypothetical protein
MGPRSRRRVADPGTTWALAALAWAVVLGILWLVLPLGQSTSVTSSSDGTTVVESSRQSLLGSEGARVVLVLAVPVVLAAIAVGVAGSRRAALVRFVCGGALAVGCLLGAMTVGLPYVPAAVFLLVAGASTPTSARGRLVA